MPLHPCVPCAAQDGEIKRYLIMNEHVDRETAVAKLLEIQKWIGKGDLVLERLNESQRPASLFDKMLACESDQGGGDGALGKKLQQEHIERAWEQLGKKVGPRAPPSPPVLTHRSLPQPTLRARPCPPRRAGVRRCIHAGPSPCPPSVPARAPPRRAGVSRCIHAGPFPPRPPCPPAPPPLLPPPRPVPSPLVARGEGA